MGESIIGDLHSQSTTLDRARGTLRSANRGLERSKKILAGMGRRAIVHKALMICIILILIIIICFIVFFKWIYKPPPPPCPPAGSGLPPEPGCVPLALPPSMPPGRL